MFLNSIISHILRTSETAMVIFDLEHFQLLRQFVLFLKIQSILYLLFTITEIVLIKYWMRFILKRMVTMDDAFIVFVLTLENLSMSILFALARVMISEGYLIAYQTTESKL